MSTAPDIFISYNREDAARAKHFADAFAAEGLSVWWDVALRSGEAYDKVTEDALRRAKAVVVLWSLRSVDSRWVRAEATLADRNKTLMPAMIEPCERPIMFELVQTAELSHWQGDCSDAAWRAFAGHVREFVGKKAVEPASQRSTSPLPRLDQLSVVVLPFSNLGRDEEQEYFADGITEDVITDLGKVSALSVIARNTAFTFKDQLVDVQKVARQLNVTHVLEGSVRRAGQRVRINVQLIDGSSGSQVWSERWDRNLDDIFALQDELSAAIVDALKVKLLPAEKRAIGDRGTSSIEAYDLYMRAKAAGNAARRREEHAQSVDLYRQALAIDPGFTPALSGIAHVSTQAAVFGEDITKVLRNLDELYEAAAARSLEDAGVQLLLAVRLTYQGKWSEAFVAFEKAAAGSPAFSGEAAFLYAVQLGGVGRVKDALEILESLRRADPLASVVRVLLQFTYFVLGRMEDSRAEYLRRHDAMVNREDNEHIELFRVWMEGDLEATRQQYSRYLATQTLTNPAIRECLDLLEEPEKSLVILRRAVDDPAYQHGTRQFGLACHLALFGDAERAAEALYRSFVEFGMITRVLYWFPILKEARQTATFKKMIRDLGIYDYWRTSGNWGDFASPVGDDDFECH